MTRNLAAFAAVLIATGSIVLATDGPGASGEAHKKHDSRGRGDTIWVTNRDAADLTLFDARTGDVRAHLAVGAGAHDIVVSRRAGKAYINNETAGTISVLSASTTDFIRNIIVGRLPHHSKISRDGRTVYVGLNGSNQIATIDTETDDVREYFSSANTAARAHAPRPSRHGRFIFVPHETGAEVTAIDAETGQIVMSVNPGVQPSEVLPAPGGLLYVSVRGEGKVKVIDRASAAIVGEVAVGTQPESLILTKDRRTLIVTLRGTPAQIAFVDTHELKLIKTEPLTDGPGTGTFGDLAVPSHDGRYVYATFDRTATGVGGVAVIDVHKQKRIANWVYPTIGRPHGIAYSRTKLDLP